MCSPLEDDGVALGLALDDVEDADGLVRGCGRETLAVVVELGIVLEDENGSVVIVMMEIRRTRCRHNATHDHVLMLGLDGDRLGHLGRRLGGISKDDSDVSDLRAYHCWRVLLLLLSMEMQERA